MCDHPQQHIVEDQSTGDSICSLCARVLGQSYSYSPPIVLHPRSREEILPLSSLSNDNWENVRWADKILLRESLMDICARLHLDNQCIVESVLSLYLRILKKTDTPLNQLLQEKHRPKVAFALWEVLKRQNIGISPITVATVCEVLPSSLLDVEKMSGVQSTNPCPADFVSQLEEGMQLPFKAAQLIKKCAEALEEYMFGRKPENVTAAVAMCVAACVKVNKDENNEDTPEYWLRIIDTTCVCRILNVRPKSVRPLIRFMEHHPFIYSIIDPIVVNSDV